MNLIFSRPGPGIANRMPAGTLMPSEGCLRGLENFKIFIIISLLFADDRKAHCDFRFMNLICV
jgi:hypothetical protein